MPGYSRFKRAKVSRAVLTVLAAAVFASMIPAQSPADAPRKADLYLIAPGGDYARYYDPLMAETALRLAEISLSTRHNRSVAQVASDVAREDNELFPRIELRPSGWPEMQTLRLSRRGETFIFSAAGENGEFLEIGRSRQPMPNRVHVGAMLFSYYDGYTAGAVVEGLRLNGEPLTDPKIAMLGSPSDEFDAYWSDDRLHLRSIGHWTAADRHPYGPFAHAVVEGDFTIEARLHTFTHVPKWRYWGLACYAELRPDSEAVGVYSDGQGLYGGVQPAGETRLMWVWDGERHFIRAYLLDGRNEPKRIARIWASPGTWEHLVESTNELARAVVSSTVSGPPARAVAATDDQLAALNRARALALRVRGDEILSATRWVRDVLEESPTCPEAHYTAAFCGAMLAMREPRGAFHQRAALLARPLAHLLFARELSEPTRPQDRLTEAWVMLACGYPDAALRAAEAVDESFAPAELRAMRMFAKRDTRGLDVHRLGGVTPLERAAWAWAASETKPELINARLAELAREDGTPAALPTRAVADDELQEAFCRTGLGLSAGRTIADLLKCDEIPHLDRMAAAERVTGALDMHMTGDLTETANLIAAVLAQDGLADDAAPEVTAAAMELCAAAGQTGGGPWHGQVITPAEYAAQQRGLMLTWLYRRAELLARTEGSGLAAKDYCTALADALRDVPGAADYFRGLSGAAMGEVYRTRACLRRVFENPFGSNIPAVYFVATDWPGDLSGLLGEAPYRFGRGSWDLALSSAVMDRAGSEGKRFAVKAQQLQIDSHAAEVDTTAVAGAVPPPE
ncbi:MAG: hypothetical protein ACP5HU_02010 [Phycisphaerae bacterium]